jgi:hypothetical protein
VSAAASARLELVLPTLSSQWAAPNAGCKAAIGFEVLYRFKLFTVSELDRQAGCLCQTSAATRNSQCTFYHYEQRQIVLLQPSRASGVVHRLWRSDVMPGFCA